MDRFSQLEESQTSVGSQEPSTTVTSDPVGRRREDRIVGASDGTRQLIAQASAAARTDLPVVLVGPAGSDKELVARAIHAWGPRSQSELEVLSCGSVPEALQSRELFGCAEGVYPAIPGRYDGALDRNARSTLLLDDLGALQEETRGRLRTALRERHFHREGEDSARALGARIIGTVHSEADLGLGDLPHHVIHLHPLAQRPEDVLPLAAHFLRVFSEEADLRPVGLTADARACLASEPWPGDVQELRERVRQAVRLAGDGAISAEALMLARDSEEIPSFKEAKRAFETRYVVGLLRRCRGNISRAARLAKKDRKDFYDVIRRTGVDPSEFRN